jgi:hypothetical protein
MLHPKIHLPALVYQSACFRDCFLCPLLQTVYLIYCFSFAC